MIRFFRRIALVEGLTNLTLFLVAMPLKYIFGNPVLAPSVGMIHGIAWIAYTVVMVAALWPPRAGIAGWMRTIFAALIPFGTFINDRYLERLERQQRMVSCSTLPSSLANFDAVEESTIESCRK